MSAAAPVAEPSSSTGQPAGQTVWRELKVSPMGKRCGFMVFKRQQNRLLLLVLPKMWLDPNRKKQWLTIAPGTHEVVLVLYETQVLAVRSNKAWAGLLDEACAAIRQATSSDAKDDEEPAEEDAELREELAALDGLIAVRNLTKQPATYQEYATTSSFSTGLTQLLNLALFSGKIYPHELQRQAAKGGGGYLVGDPPEQTDLDPLRLLAAQAFAREMEARRREVRQGYVSVTEWLPMIRGRITARGMTEVGLTGIPRAQCTYDEFTESTPLFRVLVTALEHVAQGGPMYPGAGAVFRDITDRAVAVRRDLAHIPALSVPVAAELSQRIRLNRLQSSWQVALDLARILLLHKAPELRATEEGAAGLIWTIPTEKVWEGLLERVLDLAGYEVTSQGSSTKPWKHLGSNKRPDLLLTSRADYRFVVADAKYKPLEKPDQPAICWPVDPADQNQMFAYSHLVQTAPALAVLFYPRRKEFRDRGACLGHRGTVSATTSFERNAREARANALPLRLVLLPFPAETDVLTEDAWEGFVSEHAETLGDLLSAEPKKNPET